MTPEKDNRGICPSYLSDAAQKAFFIAALWLTLAINISALFIHAFQMNQHIIGSLLAAFSIIAWRRVIWNVQTAMMFRK